jgi:hypothetical protein
LARGWAATGRAARGLVARGLAARAPPANEASDPGLRRPHHFASPVFAPQVCQYPFGCHPPACPSSRVCLLPYAPNARIQRLNTATT